MPLGKRRKSYKQPPPSPIEISFWETAKPLIPELQREVWIDQYRVDFLIPSKKVVIELYGYQYHNTKKKLTKDAERERYLQLLGYQVIRFTGTEIYKDVQQCVNEVLSLANIQPAEISENTTHTLAQLDHIPNTTAAPTRNRPKKVSAKAKPSVGTTLYRGIVSLVFIFALACFVVMGVMFVILPRSSSSDRIKSQEPYIELKKAISNSTLEWQNPKSPGKTEWQTTIPANEPVLINLGWCAANRTILDENWSHISYSLLVDHKYVELAPEQWEFETEDEVCRGYSKDLTGWAARQHTFTWFYSLDQVLNNGKDGYQPGEYIIEYTVDVN